MREVIFRRMKEYEKTQGTNESFARLPDCILLDGGKGHVAAVRPLLEGMGYGSIPLFGMVKDDKHRTRAITGDGGEIAINSNRSAFTLVSTIQDEVHRFAIGFHRQQRKKANISTTLPPLKGLEKPAPGRCCGISRPFPPSGRLQWRSWPERQG